MLFRLILGLIVVLNVSNIAFPAGADAPNIVVIFCDDLGYGDLSCFGHPTIKTPNLDRMAAEGVRLTQFYSASPVCTPSRAALMTGRLPIRSGMCSDKRRVLFPNSGGGIPESEVTLAEGLKKQGYATACIGKWHLGHLPQFLPTSNGFDSYFGIPYSNDMDRVNDAPRGKESFWNPQVEYWNVPLIRDLEIVERPADQTTITRRYAEEAAAFIKKNKDEKFFLYLPHSLPHVPLFRSKEFEGKSLRGLYGDVIEEIDWSVGHVLQTLRNLKLDQNTIVWFTSDNGPWLTFKEHGGTAGLLREGKGTTWDGGMREPSICWWPETIPAGQVSAELGTTMDIYSTSLALAGARLEKDRIVDGYDLTESLKGNSKSPRENVYYYRGTRLMALRKGPWKAHFATQESYTGNNKLTEHDPPVLYNLEVDPSEQWDVAEEHPEIIAEIKAVAVAHGKTVVAVPSQLEIPLTK
jgi:arylsulfatase A-like enzyme